MEKELLNNLKSIIKDLSLASANLPYEERFDVASLQNNIHNVKVSLEIRYVYEYYETYPASKLVNNFNYLKEHNPDSYVSKNFNDVESLKEGIVDLVKEIYVDGVEQKHDARWVEKHLKPVIAYEKVNIITMFKKENRNKETIKMVLFGNQERKGAIPAFIIYTLLIYCMLNELWDCLAYYLSKS